MNGFRKWELGGLLCIVGFLAAATARADIPPPDVCRTENTACHNAGETYDQDGLCTKGTCSKGSQSGQVTTYDCLKCEVSATLGAAGTSATTESDEHKDDGGCSVRTLGTEKGVATVLLGFGLLALGISRRRR